MQMLYHALTIVHRTSFNIEWYLNPDDLSIIQALLLIDPNMTSIPTENYRHL